MAQLILLTARIDITALGSSVGRCTTGCGYLPVAGEFVDGVGYLVVREGEVVFGLVIISSCGVNLYIILNTVDGSLLKKVK